MYNVLLTLGLDNMINKVRGLLKVITNGVPFEIYGRYAKEFNTDSGVVDGFGVDIIPIGHGTLSCIKNRSDAHFS